jgi:hypothetical protein
MATRFMKRRRPLVALDASRQPLGFAILLAQSHNDDISLSNSDRKGPS